MAEKKIDIVLGAEDRTRGAFKSAARRVRSFVKNTLRRLGSLQGLLAGLGLAFGVKQAIELAGEQEDAENRLAAALRSRGLEVERNLELLKADASALQRLSRVGDETTLGIQALALSMGATVEQAQQVAQVSADMAIALGMDVESAARNAAKTLGGYAGELGEVIPEIKELTKEQLQAGEGLDLLQEKFKGFALESIKTASGQFAQLKNAVGDLGEAVGRALTEPLRQADGEVQSIIQRVTKFVADQERVVDTASEFQRARRRGEVEEDFGDKIDRGLIEAVVKPFRVLGGFIGEKAAELVIGSVEENARLQNRRFAAETQALIQEQEQEQKKREREAEIQAGIKEIERLRRENVPGFRILPPEVPDSELTGAAKEFREGKAKAGPALEAFFGEVEEQARAAEAQNKLKQTRVELLKLEAQAGDEAAANELKRLEIAKDFNAVEQEIKQAIKDGAEGGEEQLARLREAKRAALGQVGSDDESEQADQTESQSRRLASALEVSSRFRGNAAEFRAGLEPAQQTARATKQSAERLSKIERATDALAEAVRDGVKIQGVPLG